MWSWWQIIHLSCGCCSAQCTFLHKTIDLIWWSDSPFTQSLYKYSLFLVFSHLKTSTINFKKIWDYFIVNLQVRCSYHECCVLVWLHLNKSEYFFHGSWNYTSLWVACTVFKTLHSICLSSTCLTIGKDCGIITLKDGVNSLLSCIFIHKFLSGVLIIHIIEGVTLPHAQMRILLNVPLLVSLIHFCSQVLHNGAWLVIRRHLHNTSKLTSIVLLSWQRRPHPNNYFEVIIARRRTSIVACLLLQRRHSIALHWWPEIVTRCHVILGLHG